MNLPKFIYRCLAKHLALDVTKLFVLDLQKVLFAQRKIDGYVVRELGSNDLKKIADSPGFSVSKEDMANLNDENLFCIGAFDERAGLVSYIWFARHSIDASDNRGEHPDSGVGLKLSQNTLFMYNGFTHADYRGKNIIGLIIQYAVESGRRAGVRHLVTTSDWTNQPAHRVLEKKCMFDVAGCIWRFAWMGIDFTRLPKTANQIGVTVAF